MGYKEYFKAYKEHWDTVKKIDDSLAVWAEQCYPGHSMFYWEPENEEMVRIYIYHKDEVTSSIIAADELV